MPINTILNNETFYFSFYYYIVLAQSKMKTETVNSTKYPLEFLDSHVLVQCTIVQSQVTNP